MAATDPNRRILLADDNHSLLAAAGQALRVAGYSVTSTNSGADALCLLAAKPPDLLILDVVMPGVDGYEVLNAIKPGEPPVILMSGAPIDPSVLENGGVSRVLTKPFDLSALLGAVRGVLGDAAPTPPPP
jgi:CheY-like chemotaxis protein